MNYWKLKAAALTRQMGLAHVQAQAEQIEAQHRAAMVEAGLDPQKRYILNDADESVTEQPDEAV